jgi:hypothetical protein
LANSEFALLPVGRAVEEADERDLAVISFATTNDIRGTATGEDNLHGVASVTLCDARRRREKSGSLILVFLCL